MPEASLPAAHLELTVTHQSTVTQDQIDELGHMNVRWYGHNAFAGAARVCADLGIEIKALRSAYTRHHHEQLLGSRLEVRSVVLAGSDDVRLYHELRNVETDQLGATFVHEFAHPRGDATFELPGHGQPRSLSLEHNALNKAPTVTEARSRGLAVRHPRCVDSGDVDAASGVVPPYLANNLIWAGDPVDGQIEFVRTDSSGRRFGMAVMESRMWLGRLPALGTNIQSFGATVQIDEKVARSVSWSYDTDSGEPLVAFESLNLSFDLEQRRAAAIPAHERERLESRLHTDLDPAI